MNRLRLKAYAQASPQGQMCEWGVFIRMFLIVHTQTFTKNIYFFSLITWIHKVMGLFVLSLTHTYTLARGMIITTDTISNVKYNFQITNKHTRKDGNIDL
jgi:hypothetical protein